ncbi:MAG: hypothetical protein AB7E77_10425 [Desulfobulbus sp.]
MRFFARCCCILGLIVLVPHPLPAAESPAATVQQAAYPEDEIVRRRDAINQKGKETERSARGRTGDGASRPIPIPHALPLRGTLQISSGSISTFYGKIRWDLNYTIKENFVGNLIITRYYDPQTRRYTDREEYAVDTISMEINASDFKGKTCSKYEGSPPTCSQWNELDLWQIVDGEEYPGKKCGVVGITSSGRTVRLKIDGPNILFVPSQKGLGVKSGCGDQVQKSFTRDEFKRMLQRKTIRVKKELGKAFPGCRPGSTVTLDMEIGK